MMKKIFVTIFLAGLFVFVPGMPAPKDVFASAQEVSIRVDGLACPFCAYGLEKKLKKLKGMENLKISINEGKVTLNIKDGFSVSKEDIEKVVEEAGFTPRSIDIKEK